MKWKQSPVMALSLLSLIIHHSYAGVNTTLKIDTVSGTASSQVEAAVKVYNFNDIIFMEGTIQFDPGVVSYDTVLQYGLPGLTITNFGLSQISMGIITYSWADPDTSGESFLDSSMIFSIGFTLIGATGENSPVCFINNPLPAVMMDTNFNMVVATYSCGLVHIECNAAGCDDGNSCTLDSCSNAQCLYDSIPGCTNACDSLVCNDGNICTVDSCSNNACLFDTIPSCFNLCDTLKCNDDISCTIDTCINGACLNIPIVINLGNIEGPPCAAVNTTNSYLIDSLGPDYLYQWQVSGIGEIHDSSSSFSETMIMWIDTGTATLSAIVFNQTCSDTALLTIIVVEDANCCPAPCPPNSVNEMDNIHVDVVPNPNNGTFIISLKGITGQVEVNLLNLLGQDIYTNTTYLAGEQLFYPVQLPNVESGVYCLKVRVADESFRHVVLIGR